MVYKGTVLSCDNDTALVKSADNVRHICHRPSDIPVATWKRMWVVGKETTWLDAEETAQ